MRILPFAGAAVAAFSFALAGCGSSGPKDFQGLLLEDVQNQVIQEISRWADLTAYDGSQNLADFDFVVADADNHGPESFKEESLADEAMMQGIPAVVTDSSLAHTEGLTADVGFHHTVEASTYLLQTLKDEAGREEVQIVHVREPASPEDVRVFADAVKEALGNTRASFAALPALTVLKNDSGSSGLVPPLLADVSQYAFRVNSVTATAALKLPECAAATLIGLPLATSTYQTGSGTSVTRYYEYAVSDGSGTGVNVGNSVTLLQTTDTTFRLDALTAPFAPVDPEFTTCPRIRGTLEITSPSGTSSSPGGPEGTTTRVYPLQGFYFTGVATTFGANAGTLVSSAPEDVDQSAGAVSTVSLDLLEPMMFLTQGPTDAQPTATDFTATYSASGSIAGWGVRSQIANGALTFQYGMQSPYDTFVLPPGGAIPVGPGSPASPVGGASCLALTALSTNTVVAHTAAVWEGLSVSPFGVTTQAASALQYFNYPSCGQGQTAPEPAFNTTSATLDTSGAVAP